MRFNVALLYFNKVSSANNIVHLTAVSCKSFIGNGKLTLITFKTQEHFLKTPVVADLYLVGLLKTSLKSD